MGGFNSLANGRSNGSVGGGEVRRIKLCAGWGPAAGWSRGRRHTAPPPTRGSGGTRSPVGGRHGVPALRWEGGRGGRRSGASRKCCLGLISNCIFAFSWSQIIFLNIYKVFRMLSLIFDMLFRIHLEAWKNWGDETIDTSIDTATFEGNDLRAGWNGDVCF